MQVLKTLVLAACAAVGAHPAVAADQLSPFKTKKTIWAYCRAGSSLPDPTATGGFAPSDNFPRRLDREFPEGELVLLAVPTETAPFQEKYLGFVVLLANQSDQVISLRAVDSTLNLVRQALDKRGQWRDIEAAPVAFCGNSNHRVGLPGGTYWRFIVPVYAGRYRTKMRFRLLLDDGREVLSNEFEGFMSRGQFYSRKDS